MRVNICMPRRLFQTMLMKMVPTWRRTKPDNHINNNNNKNPNNNNNNYYYYYCAHEQFNFIIGERRLIANRMRIHRVELNGNYANRNVYISRNNNANYE